LTNGKKNIYDLPAPPCDLVVCENQIIVACGFVILRYDHDFNLIEKIDQIDKTRISITRIEADLNLRRFYLCDHFESKVIATDFYFNRLASKLYGTDAQPIDISFVNNCLYVLNGESRLYEYSKDFGLIRYLELDIHPERIKISNSTICVLSRHNHKVFGEERFMDHNSELKFFNLNDFSLIRKIDDFEGKLSLINSIFYYCIGERNLLLSFNENGSFLSDYRLLDNLKCKKDSYYSFFECNGSILATSYYQQKIYKFYD
jgi:hypothetical protein